MLIVFTCTQLVLLSIFNKLGAVLQADGAFFFFSISNVFNNLDGRHGIFNQISQLVQR